MTRKGRPWWHGITPGGLIVTLTAALVTVALTGTACWLFLHAKTDVQAAIATAVLAAASSALATTVALQARNRPDPAATVEQPATVTAQPLESEA